MRVERKFYESGYADYQLVRGGEEVARVTVLPPNGLPAARLAVTKPLGTLCPEEAAMLASMVSEAAAYAAAMNTREGVTCE